MPSDVTISKFLSLVLRHKPETIGLGLDTGGWAAIDELLAAAEAHGRKISRELLDHVVFTNDKQRFAFSADGLKIRANQGHSIGIDLGLEPVAPPATLFHGTATRFMAAIRREGLRKMRRQHVHLSSTYDVAQRVGARHGDPAVLEIDCAAMVAEGHQFYLAKNGVWLSDAVPARFLLSLDV